MNQYFLSPKQRQNLGNLQCSGSAGIKSSQFSQKNNNSLNNDVRNMDPSFFNQSSINKLNDSQSGQFIYFQNGSVLSQLEIGIKSKRKITQKQEQLENKKKITMNYSNQISFEDSLRNGNNQIDDQQSQIIEYGTGKSTLPPTLKKPKFGFKTSETAESSAIMKQVGQQYQINVQQNQFRAKENKSNNPKKTNRKQTSKNSFLKSQTRQKKGEIQLQQQSISSIKMPLEQPSLASNSLNQSSSMNGSMNFKSVFKNKIEKASSINSSLNKKYNAVKSNKSINTYRQNSNSISKDYMIEKQVKIAELKDLRLLQNKLGQLKHQNKKIIQYMIEKDQQIQKLRKKKTQIESQDPYAVVKQNQLMKAFLGKKVKTLKYDDLLDCQGLGYLHSARSLKQISLKKNSQISSLHDYDVKQYKFRVEPKVLTKMQKKFILSNRGMILSQVYLDVGYSLKDNILTVYLTLKREYQQVRVQLQQNSLMVSQQIERVFRNCAKGKQIKFKTGIKSTRCANPQHQFTPSHFIISLSAQQKFQNTFKQFKVQLPITVYNIAKHVEPTSSVQVGEKAGPRQTYKTQSFIACKQMVSNPEAYLLKVFPTGAYFKDQNVFKVSFLWKEKLDLVKIRIKQRSFIVEGDGNPNKATFQILRSILSLMIEPAPQQQ